MKLQNMVKFPLTGMDMAPHMVKRSQSSWSLPSHWSPWRRPYGMGRDPEDYLYDLYAVCNHHGTMQGGHYTGNGAAGDGGAKVHPFIHVLSLSVPHTGAYPSCLRAKAGGYTLDKWLFNAGLGANSVECNTVIFCKVLLYQVKDTKYQRKFSISVANTNSSVCELPEI